MRKNPQGEPIDDGDEIDEAARHRDIGDVAAQTWFGRSTFTPRSRIGTDLVSRRGLRGVSPTIDRLDPHALRQRRDMPAADLDALASEKVAQRAGPANGQYQMQFVDRRMSDKSSGETGRGL